MKVLTSLMLGVGIALFTGGSAAWASGEITCYGIEDEAVRVSLGFGTLPVLSVISARIETPDGVYQLRGGGETTEIRFGDGAFLKDGLIARFTDDIINDVMAELRVVNMEEGRAFASVGLVRLPAEGAVYGLTCEGP
ncbi:hypothetical protein [Notoacmeibacter sp. MSK16QG-6]|uniref:hypothetical protein n=1 Tax=Notoacmeibacter sp. MSK16QG-6 TaxID=2957982 RepID=UPI0020A0D805|nr:hypothetical protein [Notoacmeibacter sp. MSK16QG-6]MCP1198956.1 hypothetical protein [Notoacmeibacter sp. MSK16QG-6]